jgi:enoyl-CoA hydratase/carnithine racemase
VHSELGPAFRSIADDADNRIVILTGAGDTFWSTINFGSFQQLLSTPKGWNRVIFEGRQLMNAFLDIDVPIISAVNGPNLLHAELPLLADIVLASETAEFADLVHAPNGFVPGDGVHVVWPMLLGVNRASYFLLTGQRLSAVEALNLGVVNEVLPRAELLPRAYELAEELNTKSDLMLRQVRGVLRLAKERAMRQDFERGFAREVIAALGGPDGLGTGLNQPAVPIEDQMVDNYSTGKQTRRLDYGKKP